MTPPAHRAKFGGPKRATAAGAPPPPADSRPRQRAAGQRALERLRQGPATVADLTRLIYGDAPLANVRALIIALRTRGYEITHDWQGYHLVSEPETNAAGRATRSPAQAIYALLTTRGNLYKQCDCGATATHVALFHQLTADNRTRFINALPVCVSCTVAFTDAEQIYTMEQAYELAKIPAPTPAEPGRPRGRPPTSADRLGHGDPGDDPGPSE